jgi:hypothetical protein
MKSPEPDVLARISLVNEWVIGTRQAINSAGVLTTGVEAELRGV